ncbi:S-layer homology domain-containing protein [Lysinibacillus macroides]|uniref:Beta-N-acetylglucosaminidase n=1 Tax=Lysinibacillus macroides TaxID=33935 RepID=A0A0N0CX46_9BACI|nr:S-layer homology domain-containing protein [Lysinibacillus macroides]KOY83894.1 beta-N-acetylglucosaminidase [Lysinibacillus macroides]QPR66662.1 S-layer homology domain-containing protein [Lysinibacillus macroides]
MKHTLPLYGAVLAGMLYLTPTTAAAEDISKHWAYHEMNYLITNDLMKGDELGNYRPNAAVTRAEFAAFLVRTLNLPTASSNQTFSDVKKDDWYYGVVQQASYYGLIKGDEQGKFNPKAYIDRQQMAAMLKRALHYLDIQTSTSPIAFNDNARIAKWAYADVQAVVAAGLLGGKPNNQFAPLAQTTRAEAATVLYRLLHLEAPVSGSKQYITTNYSQNYANVVSKQAGNNPKVDGAGAFTASEALVSYYVHPKSFMQDSPSYYQFLKLSTVVNNLSAKELNEKVLANKGSLSGMGDAFIEAGIQYNVNAIYLLSHALHETNNGSSALIKGIEVGLDQTGKPIVVTSDNREQLTEIKTAYNAYGIGAIDADANKYGAERAYTNGWFTVQDAIIGGTEFVTERYINQGQDTLYKMRWNPDNPTVHQYATHVMWADIQAKKIYELYELIGADATTNLVFDVPVYQGQPASVTLPDPSKRYALDTALAGTAGMVTINLNMRTYPNTVDNASIITNLPKDTTFKVLGENGGWLKVRADGQEGWVLDDYVILENGLQIVNMTIMLNVRSEPSTTSSIVGTVKPNGFIIGAVDDEGEFIKDGDWYQVIYNGKTGWVHGDYIVKNDL